MLLACACAFASSEIWLSEYNGNPPGQSWATAMAVDSSGQVYVTGSAEGEDGNNHYATIK